MDESTKYDGRRCEEGRQRISGRSVRIRQTAANLMNGMVANAAGGVTFPPPNAALGISQSW